MEQEELLKALIDAKNAHIADLQQTVGVMNSYTNRLFNVVSPPPRPKPEPDPDPDPDAESD